MRFFGHGQSQSETKCKECGTDHAMILELLQKRQKEQKKIEKLGWKPKISIQKGLLLSLNWYSSKYDFENNSEISYDTKLNKVKKKCIENV